MAKRRRNVNAVDIVEHWRKNWKPDCAFSGTTKAHFSAWKRKFRRHYGRCIGPWPKKVPLRLKVTESADRGDHVRKHILFDSCPGVTVPAYLLIPKGLKRNEKRPGILAAHGHGRGKADVVGVTRERGDPQAIASVDQLNYEYGLDAVRRGYIVIAPDWMPFGERRPPDEWTRFPNRDPCNVTDLAWLYFGRPLLAQSIWDGMRAVDVLVRHPNVDPKRIAVIGLSQGGTMSTHLLINEPRIKTGVVSGYISTVRGHGLRRRGSGKGVNSCGAQHVPRLLLHGDIPDMLGLAVPKPVLFEMGKKEDCFHYPDMKRAYKHLENIYRAAGVPERIDHDSHPHRHRWSGRKAWDWLEKWLG